IPAENQCELLASGDGVHFIPAVLGIKELSAGARHYILGVLVNEIHAAVNARVGKYELPILSLRVIDYVEVSVLIGRYRNLHLVSSEEHSRWASIAGGTALSALNQPILEC